MTIKTALLAATAAAALLGAAIVSVPSTSPKSGEAVFFKWGAAPEGPFRAR